MRDIVGSAGKGDTVNPNRIFIVFVSFLFGNKDCRGAAFAHNAHAGICVFEAFKFRHGSAVEGCLGVAAGVPVRLMSHCGIAGIIVVIAVFAHIGAAHKLKTVSVTETKVEVVFGIKADVNIFGIGKVVAFLIEAHYKNMFVFAGSNHLITGVKRNGTAGAVHTSGESRCRSNAEEICNASADASLLLVALSVVTDAGAVNVLRLHACVLHCFKSGVCHDFFP